MPAGRPTDYTPDLAADICARLSDGESLRSICAGEGYPNRRTVERWLLQHPEFREQYALARECQAHAIAEAALEEALAAKDAALGRLAFDARRWFCGKVAPKIYGEKMTNEITGKDGGPIQAITTSMTPQEAAEAYAALIKGAG